MRSITRLPLLVAGTVFLALGALAGTAHAQYYYGPPPGPGYRPAFMPYLYYGAGLNATAILAQTGGPEVLGNGAGADAFVGIRLLPRFALEGGLFDSYHNPAPTIDQFGNYAGTSYVVLSGLTLDGKLFLAPARRVVQPFLQGGIGAYAIGRDVVGTSDAGWGYQLGGGIDFRVGWFWTLELRALYRGVNMNETAGGAGSTLIHGLTLDGNLAVHFR